MKTKILILSILSTIQLYGQSSRVCFYAGYKPIEAEQSTVQFIYIDESPSQDFINTTVEISDNTSAVDFGFSLEGAKWVGDLHMYAGQLFGIDMGGGLYKPIQIGSSGKNFFVPQITAGVGLCRVNLGTIENNDVYIQVNDTKFGDYENVSASVQNFYFFIKPQVGISFELDDKKDLRIILAYLLCANSPLINFSGKLDDGTSTTESEDLDESNIYFLVNGEESHEAPFSSTGFEIKLALTFGDKMK